MKLAQNLVLWITSYAFIVALIYFSQSSTSATVLFVVLEFMVFAGMVAIFLDKEKKLPGEIPSIIGFPISVAIAAYAVSMGGWVAIGGGLAFFSTLLNIEKCREQAAK